MKYGEVVAVKVVPSVKYLNSMLLIRRGAHTFSTINISSGNQFAFYADYLSICGLSALFLTKTDI